MSVGNIAGFARLTHAPPVQSYIVMYGLVLCATARIKPSGVMSQPFPVPIGNIAGFVLLT